MDEDLLLPKKIIFSPKIIFYQMRVFENEPVSLLPLNRSHRVEISTNLRLIGGLSFDRETALSISEFMQRSLKGH